MNKTALLDLVNWPAVLAADRCSGGHEEAMEAIFEGIALLLAAHKESGWYGEEAFAYMFPGGQVAIVTDYFGSCRLCDRWEDADDDDVRSMIVSMVGSARFFQTVEEARTFVETGIDDAPGEEFSMRAAKNLVLR